MVNITSEHRNGVVHSIGFVGLSSYPSRGRCGTRRSCRRRVVAAEHGERVGVGHHVEEICLFKGRPYEAKEHSPFLFLPPLTRSSIRRNQFFSHRPPIFLCQSSKPSSMPKKFADAPDLSGRGSKAKAQKKASQAESKSPSRCSRATVSRCIHFRRGRQWLLLETGSVVKQAHNSSTIAPVLDISHPPSQCFALPSTSIHPSLPHNSPSHAPLFPSPRSARSSRGRRGTREERVAQGGQLGAGR